MTDDTLAHGALTWSLHEIQRRHSGATIKRMAWLVTRFRFATTAQAITALRVVREEVA